MANTICYKCTCFGNDCSGMDTSFTGCVYYKKGKYKSAASQGAYIDRLRTKYPFRIFARGYEAVLCGVQPLLEGQETPIYRFPGGDSLVDDVEIKNVIEW
jgi:hypothetical protein